ncbi:93eb211c-69b4-444c-adb4-bb3115c7e18a [Thermothielavioides terrestris]|uniref:93eb211c-69b4-444c-adb4-bb3115c7e18a n=1 Tax=Thermothielavioides terrestris TaxID=2587410 RepID=A0A3S4AVA1_9PEZI|nr:93eb211c-69b4-444c-adb4-bb3115c7e18a [Thermothielavioides terrestris]
MTLTVLADDQIQTLLENLTAADLEGFRNALASALHEYSARREGETSVHQPERISVQSAATGATTLFMPSCNSAGNGIKVITLTSPSPTPSKDNNTSTTVPTAASTTTTNDKDNTPIPPTGAIALFTPAGAPLGLLHARTLTAFRTALASLCLVVARHWGQGGGGGAGPQLGAATLVVFGGGAQAYWHVRLALLARGAEGEEGYDDKLAAVLVDADVVFCCTPSTEPLFDGRVWESEEGRKKGRLVVAIGSYTPEMREVPGELIRRALAAGEREAGVVVVDTIEGALKEAGELIEAGVRPEQLVELGEVVTPQGTAPYQADGAKGQDTRDRLAQWLQIGNVIYKSVGLGLMDLSVGIHLIQYAQEKDVGTHVPGF